MKRLTLEKGGHVKFAETGIITADHLAVLASWERLCFGEREE